MKNFFSGNPKISVIVRTIQRPLVLAEALASLMSQTYKNFEVIIIEDGSEVSREYIFSQFSDLNLHYISTGNKVGRSKAGNIGLSFAKGQYFIFLDDDDIFFPEHLEVLIDGIEKESVKAAYSIAYEVPTNVISSNPYIYKETNKRVAFNQPFNLLRLLWNNYIPIQSLIFHRSLYDQNGGFDETLDYLEDWDLWVRYAISTRFFYIPKITSKYRVPLDYSSANRLRLKKLEDAKHAIREKQKTMNVALKVADCVREIDEIIMVERKDYILNFFKKGPRYVLVHVFYFFKKLAAIK